MLQNPGSSQKDLKIDKERARKAAQARKRRRKAEAEDGSKEANDVD
jgi:hypothetical protein